MSAYSGENFAMASRDSSTLSVQGPGPASAHAPDQPTNAEPGAADGVSVTVVGASNIAVQVSPQSTPAVSETTEPEPFPISDTAESARTVIAWVRTRVTEVRR